MNHVINLQFVFLVSFPHRADIFALISNIRRALRSRRWSLWLSCSLPFLLLLLFQSRGRGRENTSPLPSFGLWSKSSDGHSGCPRQKLHVSVWLIVSAHCRSSTGNRHTGEMKERLQREKADGKWISLKRIMWRRQMNVVIVRNVRPFTAFQSTESYRSMLTGL